LGVSMLCGYFGELLSGRIYFLFRVVGGLEE